MDDYYKNYCLYGVFSTANDTEGAYAMPTDFDGFKELKSTNNYKMEAIIWAINDICPNKPVAVSKKEQ